MAVLLSWAIVSVGKGMLCEGLEPGTSVYTGHISTSLLGGEEDTLKVEKQLGVPWRSLLDSKSANVGMSVQV